MNTLPNKTLLNLTLEEEMATYSSILAWRIPWTSYSPQGGKELDTTEQLTLTLEVLKH